MQKYKTLPFFLFLRKIVQKKYNTDHVVKRGLHGRDSISWGPAHGLNRRGPKSERLAGGLEMTGHLD